METKILVCCHKKTTLPACKDYYPIHVGKSLHSAVELGIQADNEGDNISKKNESYCELTGMYWAWKHLVDVDVIGLCHYRRYFHFVSFPSLYRPVIFRSFSQLKEVCQAVPQSILVRISKGAVVTAKPEKWSVPVYTNYCEWHFCDDMLALYNVLQRSQNENYVNAFRKVIFRSNGFAPYNMFIMSRNEYDRYCSWLFPLLEKLEEETNISNYNSMQRRIYGYLAERLLDVYIIANNLERIALPILYFDDENKNKSKISELYLNVRFQLLSAIRYANFMVTIKVGHLRNSKIK